MNSTASVDQATVDRLLNRIDALSNQVEKQQINESKKPEKPKTWWETVTQFLALPAAALALVYTLTQIQGARTTPELNSATIGKVAADTSKTIAETAKLNMELAQLQADQAAGREADIRRIDSLIPRIRDSLSQVSQQSALSSVGLSLLLRYVALTLAMIGIGLIADVMLSTWAALMNLATNLVHSRRPAYPYRPEKNHQLDQELRAKYEEAIQKHDRHIRIWSFAAVILAPWMNLFFWAVRVAIFVAIGVPLFDQLATVLGSPIRLTAISDAILSGDPNRAIALLRAMVIGGPAD